MCMHEFNSKIIYIYLEIIQVIFNIYIYICIELYRYGSWHIVCINTVFELYSNLNKLIMINICMLCVIQILYLYI